MAIHPERYSGKATPVGNSKGIRIDAAFFRAHPEFSGEVDATVVGEGQVLLSAYCLPDLASAQDDDPVLAAFLGYVERDMQDHSESIQPADQNQLARIAKLVDGVDVD